MFFPLGFCSFLLGLRKLLVGIFHINKVVGYFTLFRVTVKNPGTNGMLFASGTLGIAKNAVILKLLK